MRSRALPVVAIVAALLGASGSLALGKATGWLDGGSETIVVSVPGGSETTAQSPKPIARPLEAGSFDPARTYSERSAGVVTIYASFLSSVGEPESQGSGFVASAKGHVLTNAHVITTGQRSDVEGARRVYVEFEDGERVSARIIGWDLFNDIGLLKVAPGSHRLAPIPLGDSDQVVVGEPVSAIGSPFGNQSTLTTGVVSATRRAISSIVSGYEIIDAIQTDAPINHGNSGGPLFDAAGRAIGINAQIRSNSGTNEGVGFAVPINSAKRSMAQLIATGSVQYAYMGVSTSDLTPTLARRFGYRVRYGAVVGCVKPGSPAARAGLREGEPTDYFNGRTFVSGADVIVAVNGRTVRRGTDLVRVIASELRPGQVASFRIVREAQRRTLTVKLAKRPIEPTPGC